MTKHRSISIVEYKVQQTDFFLRQLRGVGLDLFAAQCFSDAFASSARTVTLAMQAVIGKVEGFGEWYGTRQEALKEDRLARFFVEYRNVSSKIGDTVVRSGKSMTGSKGERIIRHYFLPIQDLVVVPDEDVVTVCEQYFAVLLRIVFDAMLQFRYALDDRWYFTEENFRRMGKTFGDAITELGFPPAWGDASASLDEAARWQVLRRTQAIGCQINEQFMEYLGETIPGPDGEGTEPALPCGEPDRPT